MKWLTHATDGLRNLYHAKLRAFLALLGILVGTASVVAMVLGGELATQEALKQFKSLGTDLLAVSINNTEETLNTGKSDALTLQQAFALQQVDKDMLRIAPYTQLFSPIFFQGKSINGMVLGVTDSFADIVQINMLQGRFISLADKYSFYCVIGRDIYNEIKKYTYKEPLGQSLQIGKQVFVIVGVADAWAENNFIYANIDSAVLIPVMASMIISKYTAISNIVMRLSPNANITEIENKLSKRIVDQLAGKQVSFRSAKEIIAKMQKQSDILTVFLGLIGSISLLVGGIGVMNIMLVSVIERKREIGIRLAVGAKRSDIAMLFLMEAVMLSLVGGSLGVLIGIFIAYVLAAWWQWEFTLFFWPPIAGFSVSVIIGVFFGFYPAFLAAKSDPIQALRSE